MDTTGKTLADGDFCNVIAGTNKGKSGLVRDINTCKTGHITVTVVQQSGERFKTLGKNVEYARRTDSLQLKWEVRRRLTDFLFGFN
jgi:ribosomal protein L24